MKLLIVSDLHSNIESINSILEVENSIDLICAAGDFVDYGTDPVATLDWLMSNNVIAVRGNHDEHVIEVWDDGHYSNVQMGEMTWAEHNCKKIRKDQIHFLRNLPTHRSFVVDGIAYLMSHRCGKNYETINCQYHFDKYWDLHYDIENSNPIERRMIFGHSHRQTVQQFSEDSLWLNPGSTSYRRPDEPSKDAYYIVIEDGRIFFRRTPYDRYPIYEEVLRVKECLQQAEWLVAHYFFGKTEQEGPDKPWSCN